MQEYCKLFHYSTEFKGDHRNMENFKPETTKIQPAKGN